MSAKCSILDIDIEHHKYVCQYLSIDRHIFQLTDILTGILNFEAAHNWIIFIIHWPSNFKESKNWASFWASSNLKLIIIIHFRWSMLKAKLRISCMQQIQLPNLSQNKLKFVPYSEIDVFLATAFETSFSLLSSKFI